MSISDRIDRLDEELIYLEGGPFKLKMNELSVIILDSFQNNDGNFDIVLEKGLKAMARNTGCHEGLDVLEGILDALHDRGVIDSKRYDEVVRSSACGRWM